MLNHLDRFIDASKDEKEFALKKWETATDYTLKLEKAAQDATQYTRDNYRFVVQQGGFDGLFESTGGRPELLQEAADALGMTVDELTGSAIVAAKNRQRETRKEELDIKLKESNLLTDQLQRAKLQSEISGGGGVSSTSTESKPFVQAFNNVVIGLPQASQKIAQKTFQAYMDNGNLGEAKNYLIRLATNNLPAADQTQALGRAQATQALKEIQELLDQAKEAGSSTNILKGNLVNISQKLGDTADVDLSFIGARIQQQLQVYRRSMTGVAFSPQESQEYAKIFPDITNVEKLNTAKINALTDAFDSNNKASLAFLLGESNYNSIFGKGTTPSLPSQRGQVAGDSVGGKIFVAPDGQEYELID